MNSRRRFVTPEEVTMAYELFGNEQPVQEIASRLGRSAYTVNGMLTARRMGYKTPRAYRDDRVGRKGFKSFSAYARILELERNPWSSIYRHRHNRKRELTKQEEFERRMHLKPLELLETEEKEENILGITQTAEGSMEQRLQIKEALERLRMTDSEGWEVLCERFYDGETLRRIGKTRDLSGERIRQIQARALEMMRIYCKDLEHSF